MLRQALDFLGRNFRKNRVALRSKKRRVQLKVESLELRWLPAYIEGYSYQFHLITAPYNNLGYTYDISWGDGTHDQSGADTYYIIGQHSQSFDAVHAYGDNGNYSATIIVHTGLGTFTNTLQIAVINDNPKELTFGTDSSIDFPTDIYEGQGIINYGITASDRGFHTDSLTATIDWGNGDIETHPLTINGILLDPDGSGGIGGLGIPSDAQHNGAREFGSYTGTKSFPDDNPSGTPQDTFHGSVRIDDDDGGYIIKQFTYTVHNRIPGADGYITNDGAPGNWSYFTEPEIPACGNVNEGELAQVQAYVVDPGPLDVVTVTLDWGDGTIDTQTVIPGGNAGYPVLFSKYYIDDDPTNTSEDAYQITLTVTDDDTGTQSYHTIMYVDNVRPTADLVGPSHAHPGESITLNLENLVDPGILDTHEYRFDQNRNGTLDDDTWGSSTSWNVTLGNSSGEFDFFAQVRDDDNGVSPVIVHHLIVDSSTTALSYRNTWDPQEGLRQELTGNIEVTHDLDLDLSPGRLQSGNAQLVYNSDDAGDNGARVQTLIDLGEPSRGLPDSIETKVYWQTRNSSGVWQSPVLGGGALVNLVGSTLDPYKPLLITSNGSPQLESGQHRYYVQVFLDYPGSNDVTVTSPTRYTYINSSKNSLFGAGWSLSTVDRLMVIPDDPQQPGGILRLFGVGGWRFYEKQGNSYINSRGEGDSLENGSSDTGTMEQDGSGYVYVSADGYKWRFDSNGNETAWENPNASEAMQYSYSDIDGDGKPNELVSLTAIDGSVTTFNYTSHSVGSSTTWSINKIIAPGSRDYLLDQTIQGMNLFHLNSITGPDEGVRSFAITTTGSFQVLFQDTWDGRSFLWGATFFTDGGTFDYSSTNSLNGQAIVQATPQKDWPYYGGPAATETNALGVTTKWVLDMRGRPQSYTDENNGTWTWERDANNWVKSVTDPLQHVTKYGRDATGLITEESLPDGSSRTYMYSDSPTQWLEEYRNENNDVTKYEHDASGKVTTTTDETSGITTQNNYDSDGQLAQSIDGRGKVTSYSYDSYRRIETMVDPRGAANGTTTYTYDQHGNVRTLIDPLGRTTTFQNDARGRVLSEIDPLNNTTSYEYYDYGLTKTQTNTRGYTSRWNYDSRGTLISFTEAENGLPNETRTTQTIYNANGNNGTVVDQSGSITQYQAGREVGYSGADAVQERTNSQLVSQVGLLSTTYDADGNKTSYEYRNQDHQVVMTDALLQVTTYTYDVAGNLKLVESPPRDVMINGVNTPNVIVKTSYDYDSRNRLTSTTEALGIVGQQRTTVTNYDGVGNVTTVSVSSDFPTKYEYDSLNRLTRKTEALGYDKSRYTSYEYDNNGNLVGTTTGAAVNSVVLSSGASYDKPLTTTFSYDALNRKTGMTIGAGTPLAQVITYSYSTTVPNSFGIRFNVQTEVQPLNRVTVTYFDALDRPKKLIEAYNTADERFTTYDYDAVGNLSSQTVGLANNLLNAVNYAKPLTTSFVYDALNRQTRLQEQGIGTDGSILSRTTRTEYDANGNVLRRTDPRGVTTSFVYDPLNRLQRVTEAETYPSSVMPLTHAKPTVVYVYNSANQVVHIASSSVSAATSSIFYDGLNRQVKVVDAMNHATTIVYDSNGDVDSVINPLGRVTKYSYDGLHRKTITTESYGLPQARTSTADYDAADNVVETRSGLSSLNPHPQHTTFAYDALNRQYSKTESIDDASSKRTSTTNYDSLGNITSVTTGLAIGVSNHPATTTYTYDHLNRQSEMTEAAGTSQARQTKWTYDAQGNLLSVTSGLSSNVNYAHPETAVFEYDGFNRQELQTRAYGTAQASSTISVYDLAGNLTLTVSPLGQVTENNYDALNRVTLTTSHWLSGGSVLTSSESYRYDSASNLVSHTDALGRISTFGYDILNRQTGSTDPFGAITASVYDVVGNLTQFTNGVNDLVIYVYDTFNRLTKTTDALQGVSETEYDSSDNVIGTIDENNHETVYAYDGLNRKKSSLDAESGLETWSYDADDDVISYLDGSGTAEVYSYDALGHQLTKTDGLGHTVAMTYDAGDNQTANVDSLSHSIHNSYDALGRKISTTDALGQTTSMSYDPAGNMIRLEDPDHSVTTFQFDQHGRLTQTNDPSNHVTTYQYDLLGRIASVTDKDGRRRDYTYDLLYNSGFVGHSNTEKWYDNQGTLSQTTTFTYDLLGRTRIAANDNGTYTMTYDAKNRVTHVDEPYLSLTFTYDIAGNRTGVQDSQNGSIESVYDNNNRLTRRTLSLNGSGVAQVNQLWNLQNQVTTLTYLQLGMGPNAPLVSKFTYDGAKRLVGQEQRDVTDTIFASYTYTYDNANRVTAETLNGNTTSYSYDNRNQVTGAGASQYSYDNNGNRNDSGQVLGTGNQLLHDANWDYEYDNEGNLVSKTSHSNPTVPSIEGLSTKWVYTYDDHNQLTSVVQYVISYLAMAVDVDDASQEVGIPQQMGVPYPVFRVFYTYDPFGNRISEQDVPVIKGIDHAQPTKYFSYDGWKNVQDTQGRTLNLQGNEQWDLYAESSTNKPTVRYLQGDGIDQHFAVYAGCANSLAWYETDRQQSVRFVLSGSGAIRDSISYDGFGQIISESNASARKKYAYTGREFDGLTGLQYNRTRYYDPSTSRWLSEDPKGFGAGDANLYRYAGNDSTNLADPSGLDDKSVQNPGPYQYVDLPFSSVGDSAREAVMSRPLNIPRQLNMQFITFSSLVSSTTSPSMFLPITKKEVEEAEAKRFGASMVAYDSAARSRDPMYRMDAEHNDQVTLDTEILAQQYSMNRLVVVHPERIQRGLEIRGLVKNADMSWPEASQYVKDYHSSFFGWPIHIFEIYDGKSYRGDELGRPLDAEERYYLRPKEVVGGLSNVLLVGSVVSAPLRLTFGASARTATVEASGTAKQVTSPWQYNMVENPGPLAKLPGEPASNFAGGKYSMGYVTDDLTLYRGGDIANPNSGRWFRSSAPHSVAEVRIDNAVRPIWTNSNGGYLGSSPVNTGFAVNAPSGTTIFAGPTGYQGSIYLGGQDIIQLFTPSIWNTPSAKVLSSWPLR